MRQFALRWQFLLIVAIGISLAWTNKRPATNRYTLHRYAMKNMSMDATKYFILTDITSHGLIKGLDYDCDYSNAICTFAADPARMHTDNTGTWFYITDVPPPGIDYTGHFFYADY